MDSLSGKSQAIIVKQAVIKDAPPTDDTRRRISANQKNMSPPGAHSNKLYVHVVSINIKSFDWSANEMYPKTVVHQPLVKTPNVSRNLGLRCGI